jgi:predicted phosphoribosyltransferase
MPHLLIAQALADACGADSGAVCSFIFDITGSSVAARIAEFAARPIKALIILVVAWVVNRMVRRWVDHVVQGWLERRSEAEEEARQKSEEASDRLDDLREAALRRARLLVDQQERSGQRTRTLGAVLRSIASFTIYGIAVMMALAEFDVNLGPLIAGAGIVGVAVGFEVAKSLGAPLEVLLVRKLGVPFQPELAMGAIGEGGVRILDADRVRRLGVSAAQVERVERAERAEMARQAELFRRGRPAADLDGRTAVIVDDGIATGSTALAACPIARRQGAARIVMATPVAPRDAPSRFAAAADEFVTVSTPRRFAAIGLFYADFRPTPDQEVIELLDEAREWTSGDPAQGA